MIVPKRIQTEIDRVLFTFDQKDLIENKPKLVIHEVTHSEDDVRKNQVTIVVDVQMVPRYEAIPETN